MLPSLEARTTALVLIDVQKGTLSRPLAPHSAAQIVDNAAALGCRFGEMGATLITTRSEWSELAPAIDSLPADVVIIKRRWNAFCGTELDWELRRRGIITIVLGGITTNVGVEFTAREARRHNYAVIVAEDSVTSVDADFHKFSVEEILPGVARVRSTKEILAALEAGHDWLLPPRSLTG